MLAEKYKFKIETKEELIDLLISLKLTKSMIQYNIKKYGFEEIEDEILAELGYSIFNKKKMEIKEDILTQAELFNLVYSCNRNNCFIRLRSKATGAYRTYNLTSLQDRYKLNSILNYRFKKDKTDLMYSLNLFNNMYTADEKSLLSLQNIGIDIDFDTNKYTVKEVLKHIEKMINNNELISPTLIEYGHRIRLIYSISDVPITQKSLGVYRKIGQAISDKLKEFGATPQAPTTFARINGSINSKNNAIVRYKIINQYKYNMRDLQNTLLERVDFVVNNKDKKNISMRNYYTLNLARLGDLEKIQAIRQEGYRELLCYVYRNYCLKANFSEDEAYKKMLEFNSRFDNPLKEHELNSDTKHLNRKQYLHKNETLLELFNINQNEEKIINLNTIISKNEKKRRNNNLNKKKYSDNLAISKKDKIKSEIAEICKLKKEGFSNVEISKKLNIPRSTVIRRQAN